LTQNAQNVQNVLDHLQCSWYWYLTMSKIYRITIDLKKHPQVFDRLAKSAAKENRSLAKQVLHEVLPILQKEAKA
jgi:hypothetical protein